MVERGGKNGESFNNEASLFASDMELYTAVANKKYISHNIHRKAPDIRQEHKQNIKLKRFSCQFPLPVQR
jgi:hypothetical protein